MTKRDKARRSAVENGKSYVYNSNGRKFKNAQTIVKKILFKAESAEYIKGYEIMHGNEKSF